MSSSRWLVLAAVLAVGVVGSGCGEVASPEAVELDAPREVSATTDDPIIVTVTWKPPVRAEGVTGYVVYRDGVEQGRAQAGVQPRRFRDVGGPLGSFGTPRDVTAASDIEGVRLTWSPASENVAPVGRYTVRALYGGQLGPKSNEAIGSCPPPDLDTYELSRDDGDTWEPTGKALSFLDRDAPRAPVALGAATVKWEDPRTLMHVSLKSAPVVGEVPAGQYRVRARGKTAISLPSAPVEGRRARGRDGDLIFQWQRASVDVDSAYRDVPSVTGREWVDRDVRPGKFFWRAVVTSPWATGVSASASGEAFTFTQMSLGLGWARATCGVRSDGQLRCWGSRLVTSGIPSGSFKSVTVADDHACAIRSDDRLICWGFVPEGSPPVVPPGPSVELYKSLVSRDGIDCGILLDGTVNCFGRYPVPPTTEHFKSVVPGTWIGVHACGVRLDDTLFCWGTGAPQPPPSGTFKAVESNYDTICAIRSDDKLWCWQEGRPIAPPSTSSFQSISLGARCGLRTDGELECWDNVGHSGRGAFKTVFFGYFNECGITPDDRIACWGSSEPPLTGPTPALPYLESARGMSAQHTVDRGNVNETCRLTVAGRVVCDFYDTTLMPAALFKDTFQWVGHTCALATDQHVICWSEATKPSATARFKQLFEGAASRRTCGIDTDSKLSCWGALQRFNDPLIGPAEPTTDTFTFAASGSDKVAAVRSDGQVVEWGAGSPPAGDLVGVVAKAVALGGGGLRCVIKLDDTVSCSGIGGGSLPALSPPITSKFQRITIGPSGAACGVRTDGKLECWGRGYVDDRLPDVTGTETFKDVYLRSDGSCALRNDDKLVCWGNATSSLPTLAFIPSAGPL